MQPKKTNSNEMEQLEKLRTQLSDLLQPDFSSLVLSSVAGTRTSNNQYHCAIFTSEKVSLVERSSRQSSKFEFNFDTHTFESDQSSDPIVALGTFNKKLAELSAKVHTGKATIKKNL